MLASFSLVNFKSYARATLPLAPLTVLVGANAAGKSNLIEAMQLLAWLASGRRLADLSAAMKSGEMTIRGSLADLPLVRAEPIALGCTLVPEPGVPELSLQLELKVDNGGPRIVGEDLTASDTSEAIPYYYRIDAPAHSHGSEVSVAYNNFARGGKTPHITCIDQQAMFTQLLTPARFEHPEAQRKIPEAALRLQRALSSTLFLDPNPKEMRGYAYADEHALRGDGSNVSSTLKFLCDRGDKEAILGFVRKLPEQDIADIDFLTTPRNEVMARLTETFGGHSEIRDGAVLSDGTLRVLAIAAAVLSVAEGSLVVIEEIDNGVHPSRAKLLLDALYDIAKQRRLRVLLTTHNPALADATPLAAIPDVVANYREVATGRSALQRLAALDDYAALVAQGPLGFLLSSGTLDRYMKHRRDEAERARQAGAALDLFQRAGK
ncbi:MAG TPA: ATP-binding protein [Kofleriaceae bacterium]|nr:ATP-binding protein [Kofleriaceae bacterium]